MGNHPPHPPDHSLSTLPGTNHAAASGRRTPTPLILRLLLLFLLHTTTAQNDASLEQPPDPDPYGQQFNPSMTIIMLVVFSVLFLVGFFSVYVRQCAENWFRSRRSSDQSEGQFLCRRVAAHGIDASVIQSFPTFQYSSVKGLKIGKGSLECAVCLNEFEDDDVLRLLPRCNHVFHSNCIDAWLSSRTTCPVCRANLVPKPGEKFNSPKLHLADPEPSLVTSNPPDQACIIVEDEHDTNSDSQSPQMEEDPSTDKSKSPQLRSTGTRFTRLLLFPRSHSTGHSLVQPGEDCKQFTLRLPEQVRHQLIKSASPNQAKSGEAIPLPRARSARTGYRQSESNGGWRSVRERNNYDYQRFDQEDRTGRWGLSMTPSFIGKSGSLRSTRGLGGDEVVMTPHRSLARSDKSQQFGQLFITVASDDGERSSDRLRPSHSQV